MVACVTRTSNTCCTITRFGWFHKFMIPRVADLNSNVSGAASTTGSILDTSCCVYMDIPIIMQSFGTITAGLQRGNMDISWRHIHPLPTTTNSTTKPIANDRRLLPRDDLTDTATTINHEQRHHIDRYSIRRHVSRHTLHHPHCLLPWQHIGALSIIAVKWQSNAFLNQWNIDRECEIHIEQK